MSHTQKPLTHPGPWWLWITAWSLQGVGVLITSLVDLQHWLLELLVIGVIAALPLVALYLLLLRPPLGKHR